MEEKRFKTLFAKAKTGKIKFWDIKAIKGTPSRIVINYGYVGQDEEKIQSTERLVAEGKNVGRSNETSPFEQACLEAESMWNKKKDSKYVENPNGESNILLPMLALDYKKRGKHILWPAYLQPKLDGIRMLVRKLSPGELLFTSRKGKEFETLVHLEAELDYMMEVGAVLDGEIFNPEMTFQEICSATKGVKTRNQDARRLQFWVYDCIINDVGFEDRIKILQGSVPNNGMVVLVETRLVKDEEELKTHHSDFLEQGFEGTIIRNREGLYLPDYRSPDLQKYKDFFDDEFEIVGGKEGVGRAAGTITWRCITKDGKEFEARPRGTEVQRREWWENLDKYIGQMLTVRYQELTDDGVPRFPVGIEIRNYE